MKAIITIVIDLCNIIVDAILGILDNTGILEDIARFFGHTIDAKDIVVNDETIINDEDVENRAIKNGWNPDDYDLDDVEHFLLSEEERRFVNEQNADELQKKFDEQDFLNEEHDESDLDAKDPNGKMYRTYSREDIISSLEMFRKNAENIDKACVFGFIKYKVENPDTEEQVGDIYEHGVIIEAIKEIREMYLNISFGLYYDYLYEVIGEYEAELASWDDYNKACCIIDHEIMVEDYKQEEEDTGDPTAPIPDEEKNKNWEDIPF